MKSLIVTAEGYVTLSRDMIEHLGAKPGDTISVEVRPDGRIELSRPVKTGKISDFAGSLKRPGQPVLTIDEMNEVIADAWAGNR